MPLECLLSTKVNRNPLKRVLNLVLVVAARHCEIKCFAISMITNICNPTYDVKTEVNHEEVIECATTRGDAMVKLITAIINKW